MEKSLYQVPHVYFIQFSNQIMISTHFSWEKCIFLSFKLLIPSKISTYHYLIWELIEIDIRNFNQVLSINNSQISFIFQI